VAKTATDSSLLETSNSNTLAYTDSVTNQIEARFMKMPEVQNVLASVGVSGSGRDAGGLKTNMSELTVQLKKDAKITDAAFAFKVKNEFNDIPGATVTDALLDINGSAGNLPVQILVSSNDRAKAIEYGKKVMDILQNSHLKLVLQVYHQGFYRMGISLNTRHQSGHF